MWHLAAEAEIKEKRDYSLEFFLEQRFRTNIRVYCMPNGPRALAGISASYLLNPYGDMGLVSSLDGRQGSGRLPLT